MYHQFPPLLQTQTVPISFCERVIELLTCGGTCLMCVCVYITPACNHWFFFFFILACIGQLHTFINRKNLGYVVMVCLIPVISSGIYIYHNCYIEHHQVHTGIICIMLSGNWYIYIYIFFKVIFFCDALKYLYAIKIYFFFIATPTCNCRINAK